NYGLGTQGSGEVLLKIGQTDAADKLIAEALEIAREHQVTPGVAESAALLAEVRIRQGRLDEATTLLAQAIETGRGCIETCGASKYIDPLIASGRVAVLVRDRDRALRVFTNAEAFSRAHGYGTGRAESLLWLARLTEDPHVRYDRVSEAYEILA